MQETRYGIRTTLSVPFAEALAVTRQALQSEGFGVVCEIDMRAKMKEKLNVDFPHYVILGACHPPLARRALIADPDLGLLLPCNVVVYEDVAGQSIVATIDPKVMMEVAGKNAELQSVAAEARIRLVHALQQVQTTLTPTA